MAWSACQTDYLTSGLEQDKTSFFTKEKLNENLNQGEITEVNIDVEGNGELTYKSEGASYKIQIIADGVIRVAEEIDSSEPSIKDPVVPLEPEATNLLEKIKTNPAGYYGKKVIGYEANGINDWRIFYSDDENVFLITTDYLPSDKAVACNSTMTANGKCSVYWNPLSPVLCDVKNERKFSPITKETTGWMGDYGSSYAGKSVSTLLDTNKWDSLLDDSKALMAIGSPTVQMWVASWNTKYPNDKMYCNSSDDFGLNIGWTSSPTSAWIDSNELNSKEGYLIEESDNMFFPHKSRYESASGYWISSVASFSSASPNVFRVSLHNIGGDGYTTMDYAVRPVVCLRSDVKMIENADGSVTISN